jgi:RNA polymerase sigma-70 factor (ECF subfamily)
VTYRADGPLSAQEEQRLIQQLLAGDEEAVRTVYGRFARPVFTLGLRLLGSAEAAEELTQDVFLAAWRKAGRFDPARGRLSTWLMSIAHNLAVDRLRHETGATRPNLLFLGELPERHASSDDMASVVDRDEADRAMAPLSPSERKLLMLAYFRGYTAREISEMDGIPLGTVKTRLRTALIKLRRAGVEKEG